MPIEHGGHTCVARGERRLANHRPGRLAVEELGAEADRDNQRWRRENGPSELRNLLLLTLVRAVTRVDNAAARREIADHRRLHRIRRFDDVRKKTVNHILLEDTQISIGQHIHLQRFQFQTTLSAACRSIAACRGRAAPSSDRPK